MIGQLKLPLARDYIGRVCLIFTAAAAMTLSAAVPQAAEQKPKEEAKVGKPVPDFTLPDENGKKWTLSDQKDKKVVLIILSSTMCECGQAALSDIQKVQDRYANKGVQVLHINLEPERDRWDPGFLKRFAKERGITYPLLLDKERRVIPVFPLPDMPMLYIVDKQGVLSSTIGGRPKGYFTTVIERVSPLVAKSIKSEDQQ